MVARRPRATAAVAAILLLLMALAARVDAASAAATASLAAAPPRRETERLLERRIDALGKGVGIVVGIAGPRGRTVVAHGERRSGDRRTLDGQTRFEIGSLTKIFTALLLTDMAARGEVGVDEAVARYLPAVVPSARPGERAITLLDLATHTAGLPFMPPEIATATNLRALPYDRAHLAAFTAHLQPATTPGASWQYSNVGYWMLGEALAARAGTDFPTLLARRVLAPLGLQCTTFAVPAGPTADFASGHDVDLQEAPALAEFPVFAAMPAAGGLWSCADDLLSLLEVALGDREPRWSALVHTMLATRRSMGEAGSAQAVGWLVQGTGDDELVFHDGGTLGFASALAWDPHARVGVVVLGNQVAGVGDLARHLLRPALPVALPPRPHHEVGVPVAALDACAGSYAAPGEGTFVVARDGAALTITLPADWGLPRLALHPESSVDYFARELPLRVHCHLGPDGRADSVLVYPPRGQRSITATRSAAPAP